MNNQLKEKVVTSEKTEQLLSYILPFYDNDKYTLSIFQAKGRELEKLFDQIESFFDQPFLHKATWGLNYWEQLYGLPNAEGEPYPVRRNRILNFINAKYPINKDRIEIIAREISGLPVKVYQLHSKYTFHVVLIADDLIAVSRNVWQAIYDAKPAHLAAKYYIKIGGRLYFYDIDKKTAAQVIKFHMRIGKGTSIDRRLIVNVENAIGTARPFFSSELICGDAEIGPALSKNKSALLNLAGDHKLGTGKIKNIKIYSEQSASSQTADVGVSTYSNIGSTDIKFCGLTYSGGDN